jgi:hypothetical protein
MCVLREPLKLSVDIESIQDVSSFNYAKGKVVAAIKDSALCFLNETKRNETNENVQMSFRCLIFSESSVDMLTTNKQNREEKGC